MSSFPNVFKAILYIVWFYDWSENIDKAIWLLELSRYWVKLHRRWHLMILLWALTISSSSDSTLSSLVLCLWCKWHWENENYYVKSDRCTYKIPTIVRCSWNTQYLAVLSGKASLIKMLSSKTHYQLVLLYTRTWNSTQMLCFRVPHHPLSIFLGHWLWYLGSSFQSPPASLLLPSAISRWPTLIKSHPSQELCLSWAAEHWRGTHTWEVRYHFICFWSMWGPERLWLLLYFPDAFFVPHP
jgi:hypothetical protein